MRGGTESLPAAGLTVRVVGRDAGAAHGQPADGCAGVGEGVFGLGLVLLVLALGLHSVRSRRSARESATGAYLIGGVASERSE